MCLGLDTSMLTAVASFSLAVSLMGEMSCYPATTTTALVIPELKIGHTDRPQPDDGR